MSDFDAHLHAHDGRDAKIAVEFRLAFRRVCHDAGFLRIEGVVAAFQDVQAGEILVPRWRMMISPAVTAPAVLRLTPSRFAMESRPNLVEPIALV